MYFLRPFLLDHLSTIYIALAFIWHFRMSTQIFVLILENCSELNYCYLSKFVIYIKCTVKCIFLCVEFQSRLG